MTNDKGFNARLYWLHTITSLHVGAGRGAGAIDLPLVRERATQWPYVPGSGVKGVLASLHGAADAEKRQQNNVFAFGKPPADNTTDVSESAGSLVFCDARLLCLPVRSLMGTFAWVTCPLALQRLKEDWQRAGVKDLPDVPSLAVDKAACVLKYQDGDKQLTCPLVHEHTNAKKETINTIYLEDLDLQAVDCSLTASWADKLATALAIDNFQHRFAVVHNDVFQFLCTTALEVRARIGIDSASKTVKAGALWYEEALPSESILYGLVWCDKVFGGGAVTAEHLFKQYCQGEVTLQMGGKASTGKGIVRAVGLSPAPAQGAENGR